MRSIEQKLLPRNVFYSTLNLSIIFWILIAFCFTNHFLILNKFDGNPKISAGIMMVPNTTTFLAAAAVDRKPTFSKYEDALTEFKQTKDILQYQLHEPPLSSGKNKSNFRLEFIHIPKTGGSALEVAAAEKGILWGNCHFYISSGISFLRNLKYYKRGKKKKIIKEMCPRVHGERVTSWPSDMSCLWHYPLHILENDPNYSSVLPSDPYDNLSRQQHQQSDQEKPRRFFTVIRNPYDRIVSEYYYSNKFDFPKGDHHVLNLPQVMNHDILWKLSQWRQLDFNHTFQCGHFIPQHKYVFEDAPIKELQGGHDQRQEERNHKRRRVHHILKFENLTQEFDELMGHYGLNISLSGSMKKEHRVRSKQFNLTANHLEMRTILLIEYMYHQDFILGNYTMLSRSFSTEANRKQLLASTLESLNNISSTRDKFQHMLTPSQ